MISRGDIINKAHACGFEDIGFTSASKFESQQAVLTSLEDEYAWTNNIGIDLAAGVDPINILPTAKSIIVLMEVYFRESYPQWMEHHFGRCYLDDDRVTKDGLYLRIKAFRSFLRDNGIDSKVPFNLSHRLAAARAGMGNFGKNCLFYSNKVAGLGSWVLPIAVVVDHELEPGEPTLDVGCPSWCKNACISACPTGALKGNRRIDPRQCISFLSYYGEDVTPVELREPMGLWVFGCDHCQNVCPRNQAWLARDLRTNEKVRAKESDFSLAKLLHMDIDYFSTKIWPHMFYTPPNQLWRWKMNVARVMGNLKNPQYLPDLNRALNENQDLRVKEMAAWAIDRIP